MKDIANRYKLLRGYRIHYFPGWDCHGMPIEQKALAETRTDDRALSAIDVRNKGRHHFADLMSLFDYISGTLPWLSQSQSQLKTYNAHMYRPKPIWARGRQLR